MRMPWLAMYCARTADNAVHTLFDHAFGHINGHVLHSLIDEGVVKGVLRGLFLLLNRLGADVGLEIGERVKVVVLRELVVQLGQLFKLDLVALDVEHDGLAAEIVAVVFRESNVKIALLAGGNADELALKAGNEGVGAENEILVLRRAAVERDAVEHAGVVDVHGVAVLRGRSTVMRRAFCLRRRSMWPSTSSSVTSTEGFSASRPLYWPRVTSG